jgi:replicative DNA helicase
VRAANDSAANRALATDALAEIVATTKETIDTHLAKMMGDVVSAMNVEQHAKEGANQAKRRRVIAYAGKVATWAHDQQQPVDELVDVAMAELTKAAADHAGNQTVRDAVAILLAASRQQAA